MKAKFLHAPDDVGFNVLLVGIDFEGETRESKHLTLSQAVSVAYQCSISDSSGTAWISWEIWGNVLSKNSDWEMVVCSIKNV